jgi:hypothetical protein
MPAREHARQSHQGRTVVPISGDVYKELGRASAGAVGVVAAYGQVDNEIVALTVSSSARCHSTRPW